MLKKSQRDTVLILAAGEGTRMEPSVFPKHLLPHQGKAILSWIIEAFPKSTVFKIIIHPYDTLTAPFIETAHEFANVTFIRSTSTHRGNPLYDLKELLTYVPKNTPVFFTVADGVYSLPLFTDIKNWIGVSKVPVDEKVFYTNTHMKRPLPELVGPFKEKAASNPEPTWSWTGLAYFSSSANLSGCLGSTILANENSTFSDLFNCLRRNTDVYALQVPEWQDLGTASKYKMHSGVTAWDRTDQITYHYPDLVVKAFADREDAYLFQLKSLIFPLRSRIPNVSHRVNYVSYPKLEGSPAYGTLTSKSMVQFLNVMLANVWRQEFSLSLPSTGDALRDWAIAKTQDRLVCNIDVSVITGSSINGVEITESWDDILDSLSTAKLATESSFVHGDFTLDNLLVSPDGVVLMIDWRPKTSLLHPTGMGDVYYDLGKFWLSLEIDLSRVKTGELAVLIEGNDFEIQLPTNSHLTFLQEVFEDWCAEQGFDLFTLKMNAAMQLASMSGLHGYPYSQAFWLYSLCLANKIA